MSTYLVVYERAEDGAWGAYVPDLPGVVALGTSRNEAEELIQEAISAYAAEQELVGSALPAPTHEAGFATA